MNLKIPSVFLLAVLVSGFPAAPALGSLIPRMSLEELVDASDAIVEGVVENVESRWEDRLIFSYVTIRIEDSFKGRRSRTVTVRQVGGRIGSRILDVPGMPEFRAGDRIVVFLGHTGNGTFHVVGMAQGRYRVDDDRAVANLSGADFIDRRTAIRGAATPVSVPVDTLKARIRELVR